MHGLKPNHSKIRAEEDVIDLKNSSENLSYSSEDLKLNSEFKSRNFKTRITSSG